MKVDSEEEELYDKQTKSNPEVGDEENIDVGLKDKVVPLGKIHASFSSETDDDNDNINAYYGLSNSESEA